VLLAKESVVTVHVKVQREEQLDLGQFCALLRNWKNVFLMVLLVSIAFAYSWIDRVVSSVGVHELPIYLTKCKCLCVNCLCTLIIVGSALTLRTELCILSPQLTCVFL
jgi:hypothetical protein